MPVTELRSGHFQSALLVAELRRARFRTAKGLAGLRNGHYCTETPVAELRNGRFAKKAFFPLYELAGSLAFLPPPMAALLKSKKAATRWGFSACSASRVA